MNQELFKKFLGGPDMNVAVVLDKHIHFVDCTAFKISNPIYFTTVRDPVERFVSRYVQMCTLLLLTRAKMCNRP